MASQTSTTTSLTFIKFLEDVKPAKILTKHHLLEMVPDRTQNSMRISHSLKASKNSRIFFSQSYYFARSNP
uniref:Uncharacterized protein n=1 Tax=Rhizophora mucronata TaxID=61149 RepID=A0A2P2JAX0_RHIMU